MTPGDLMRAVAALLKTKWPDRTVYLDPCPAKFKRPSFTLLVTRAERADLNFCLVRWDVELALVVSGETDAYHLSSYEDMLADREAAAALFTAGYLTCGDRRPAVEAALDGQDRDEAYLLLTAAWTDARPGAEPEPGAAEHFSISVDTKGKE